jgi:hypothetical protein
MMLTYASARRVHWPSNQQTVSSCGRAPFREALGVDEGSAAGGF